jgi:hypothetical protein
MADSGRSGDSFLRPPLSPYSRLSLPRCRPLSLFSFLSSNALSLLRSLFRMGEAAKKCALSVSVSLALSVRVSALRLARSSSEQELTPTVFEFDGEVECKGLGGRTIARSTAVPHISFLLHAAPLIHDGTSRSHHFCTRFSSVRYCRE